jgi:hypothetical protein
VWTTSGQSPYRTPEIGASGVRRRARVAFVDATGRSVAPVAEDGTVEGIELSAGR